MKQISCNQARELISPYLDGYTAAGDTEVLEHHLNQCMHCAGEVEGYRKISNSLFRLNEVNCPDNLNAAIMSRLQEELPVREQSLRQKTATRFGAARKALAAAAAAVLIMAGSAGFSAGYKLVAGTSDNVPDPPPKQHYEVAVNNGETKITDPGDKVTEPEPVINNTPTKDLAGEVTRPSSSNPQPAAVATNLEGNNAVVTDREPAVLLSHDIIIESSILKVAVNSVEEARQKAVNLAAGTGGKAQTLSRSENGTLVQIMQITVPKAKAPEMMAALSGLGRELDRQHEKQNITAQYRELATKYNELIAVNEAAGDSALEGQITAAKEQLNNWTRDAGNYTIVLWLEH